MHTISHSLSSLLPLFSPLSLLLPLPLPYSFLLSPFPPPPSLPLPYSFLLSRSPTITHLMKCLVSWSTWRQLCALHLSALHHTSPLSTSNMFKSFLSQNMHTISHSLSSSLPLLSLLIPPPSLSLSRFFPLSNHHSLDEVFGKLVNMASALCPSSFCPPSHFTIVNFKHSAINEKKIHDIL